MKKNDTKLIRVIDSHTGGEPTRLVISGGPDAIVAFLQPLQSNQRKPALRRLEISGSLFAPSEQITLPSLEEVAQMTA